MNPKTDEFFRYVTASHQRQCELEEKELRHRKQDALIADFTDDELAALKSQAITNSNLDENTRKFIAGKNPRTSRLLKSMISDSLKMGEVPT